MLSRVWLFETPWTAIHQASLSITNSRSLLKLMSIELVMPSHHLILCHPLLPPSIIPSIRVFSNESVLHIRWPKYWSFSFSISPSNEYSGLISFRMDWLDFLVVEGSLKSLLQYHSSKASVLQCFSSVQFSCSVMSDSLWPHESQHSRPPCLSPTAGVYPNSCPSSRWCHPTISSSVTPSLPAFDLSQHHGIFQWISSSHQVAKVLELQLQHQFFQWVFKVDFL